MIRAYVNLIDNKYFRNIVIAFAFIGSMTFLITESDVQYEKYIYAFSAMFVGISISLNGLFGVFKKESQETEKEEIK